MASPKESRIPEITLGQFLLAEDVNQAASMVNNLKILSEHDVIMIRKVLQDNWEDEEQMVSNLLQFPQLIPGDIRLDCLQRGLCDLESPYYILSASVGIQKLLLSDIEWQRFVNDLKKACLHEIGIIAMRAFITLQPRLQHPNDTHFITDILRRPKSSLFQNALMWLIIKVRSKTEIMNLLNEAEIPQEALEKAEKIIDENLTIETCGNDRNLSLQLLDYIPNLNDFDVMLDKQDTLSEFFVDIDTDKDGKVSLDEVCRFLEDIGNKLSIEELKKDLKSIEMDENGYIDKDGFIELMFPRFQMR